MYTVYIAGKMKDKAWSQVTQEFANLAWKMKRLGYTPINPARLRSAFNGLTEEQYFSICMHLVEMADAIAVLPDWEDSEGARAEVAFAKKLNKAIISWESDAEAKHVKLDIEPTEEELAELLKVAGVETTKEDVVNHPSHYKHGIYETLEEMQIVFGAEATKTFCVLCAWKYRSRAPYKGKMEQDMDKANRFLQYASHLSDEEIKLSSKDIETLNNI